MTTATRRRRERVTRSDGTTAVQTRPPRADVLWYPRHRWTTVLVRRTHDLEVARELAEQRWAEIGEPAPLVKYRVGWWRTYGPTECPPEAAQDQHGRVVLWCDDTSPGAGPGIEFRP